MNSETLLSLCLRISVAKIRPVSPGLTSSTGLKLSFLTSVLITAQCLPWVLFHILVLPRVPCGHFSAVCTSMPRSIPVQQDGRMPRMPPRRSLEWDILSLQSILTCSVRTIPRMVQQKKNSSSLSLMTEFPHRAGAELRHLLPHLSARRQTSNSVQSSVFPKSMVKTGPVTMFLMTMLHVSSSMV
ncbi:unknown [Bacteroides sp. CAG:770]|nr:unknown [Bacteroides sp. CAG:770]